MTPLGGVETGLNGGVCMTRGGPGSNLAFMHKFWLVVHPSINIRTL